MLWDKIEAARPDCTFVYITHDLDFAATRTAAKIRAKEYDGTDWDRDEVPPGPATPDWLLSTYLGTAGRCCSSRATRPATTRPSTPHCTRTNWSCHGVVRQAVEATKSMGRLSSLHNLSVRGLVDRDRRGNDEIKALHDDGMLVADVAEVENLLCLPEGWRP